jgi:hypothetical protein
VEEDSDVALTLARRLERAGYACWYYERDSIPGLAYLLQVGAAVDACEAMIVIVSPAALDSSQMTTEIVRAHEANRNFIPVLRGISHSEFQRRQPLWRQAFGAAASVSLPNSGRVGPVYARILAGVAALVPRSDDATMPLERPAGGGRREATRPLRARSDSAGLAQAQAGDEEEDENDSDDLLVVEEAAARPASDEVGDGSAVPRAAPEGAHSAGVASPPSASVADPGADAPGSPVSAPEGTAAIEQLLPAQAQPAGTPFAAPGTPPGGSAGLSLPAAAVAGMATSRPAGGAHPIGATARRDQPGEKGAFLPYRELLIISLGLTALSTLLPWVIERSPSNVLFIWELVFEHVLGAPFFLAGLLVLGLSVAGIALELDKVRLNSKGTAAAARLIIPGVVLALGALNALFFLLLTDPDDVVMSVGSWLWLGGGLAAMVMGIGRWSELSR